MISPPDPSPSSPPSLPGAGAAPAAVTSQGAPGFSAVVAQPPCWLQLSPHLLQGWRGLRGFCSPSPAHALLLCPGVASAPARCSGADESRAWCLIYNQLGTQLWQGRARQEMWQCPGSCAHTAYQRMLERLSNARGGLGCFIPAEDKLLYYRDTCLGEGAESWILELVQPGIHSSWSFVHREPG